MLPRWSLSLAAAGIALGLLAGGKCVPADPVLTGAPDAEAPATDLDSQIPAMGDASTSTGAPDLDAGALDALDPDAGVGRPNACRSTPNEARLVARDFEFQIECGCDETSGKTCTILAGMEVTWFFRDAETHDVSGNVRAMCSSSGAHLTGSHRCRFDAPGIYGYQCNEHSAEMNGYTIRVR